MPCPWCTSQSRIITRRTWKSVERIGRSGHKSCLPQNTTPDVLSAIPNLPLCLGTSPHQSSAQTVVLLHLKHDLFNWKPSLGGKVQENIENPAKDSPPKNSTPASPLWGTWPAHTSPPPPHYSPGRNPPSLQGASGARRETRCEVGC